MASGLSTLSATLAVLRNNTLGDFSLGIYINAVVSISRRILHLYRYYGLFTSVALNLFARNIWSIELELLDSGDDSLAEAFRTSHTNECNMTAVTSAILASLAIAGLNLTEIEGVHWTAYAFFTASLISGSISVFCASKQQKTMGRFLHAEQLRSFIRVEKNILTGGTILKPGELLVDQPPPNVSEGQKAGDPSLNAPESVYLPSPASCMLFSTPRILLAASVLTFIVGIGIYLVAKMLTQAKDILDKNDGRNVLIVYCVVTAFCVLFYAQSTLVTWSQSLTDYGDTSMDALFKKRRYLLRRSDQARRRVSNTGNTGNTVEGFAQNESNHGHQDPKAFDPNTSLEPGAPSPIELQMTHETHNLTPSQMADRLGTNSVQELMQEAARLAAEQSRIARKQCEVFERMARIRAMSKGADH